MAVGTHFQERHRTKIISVFLAADGEASCWLLPSSVSLLSGGTVQPENTYSCIVKVAGQVNTFSFNQPNRKKWGSRVVDIIKYLMGYKVFLS